MIYFVGGWGPDTGVRKGGDIPKRGDVSRERAIAWLDTAIAVCLAESNGNTAAANPTSSARGLWQIMVSVHKEKIAASTEYYKKLDGGNPTVGILDPRVNTAVAREVYSDAGGWRPWETYTDGSYKTHLGHGEKAYTYVVNNLREGGREQLIEKVRDGFRFDLPDINLPGVPSVPNPVRDVLVAARDGLVTIGVALAGAALIIVGVVFFLSQSKTAKGVAKTAVDFVPAGKAAKLAGAAKVVSS